MNSQTTGLRRLKLLLLGLAVSWGLCAWYHQSRPTLYEARARLKVERPEEAVAQFASGELLVEAAQVLAERDRALDPAAAESTEELQGTLRATPAEDGTLEVVYRTSERMQAVSVLSAILDAYLLQGDEATSGNAARIQELEIAKRKCESELQFQQSQQREVEQKLAELKTNEVEQAVTLERVKTLSKALAEARLQRLELERDVLQVRRDLEEQLPLQILASRLPEGRIRETVQSLLQVDQLSAELAEKEAALEKMSGVFGRRHPQLQSQQEQIAELKRRLAGLKTVPVPTDPAVCRDWLLEQLEASLAERRRFEQDLQDQLELEQETLVERASFERQHAAIVQKVALASHQLEAVTAQLEAENIRPQQRAQAIVQTPWLSPEPVGMGLGVVLILGSVAGAAGGWMFAWLIDQVKGTGGIDLERLTAHATTGSIEPLCTLQERRAMRQARLQMNRV